MPHFPPTEFLLSAWQPNQFPADRGAEIAFAGRSNAGKSSAINLVTGRSSLARVSRTPGRTQLINFFGVGGAERRIVDLPGYGYAKVPATMQQHWRTLLARYLQRRASLVGLVIVMDARRPLTEVDRQLLAMIGPRSLDVHVLLTKCDKLSRSQAAQTLARTRAAMDELTTGTATVQRFSAVSREGLDEARQRVLSLLAGAKATDKKNPDGG
ncbi:MAG: YihA family ribosome biogenesis GTP-binding protein [Proteobacteria bacterium]|nr:MAG: YihA family ribosome biogenesis GTP-binding protein [Pseudomonadota bacterium]